MSERLSEMLELCEALRRAAEPDDGIDPYALRKATCTLVAALKHDGLPIERIVSRVKTLATEAGFPADGYVSRLPQQEHLGILLEEIVRICIEEYYRDVARASDR